MSGPGDAPVSIPVKVVEDSIPKAEVRRRLEAVYVEMRKTGGGLSHDQERTIIRAVLL